MDALLEEILQKQMKIRNNQSRIAEGVKNQNGLQHMHLKLQRKCYQSVIIIYFRQIEQYESKDKSVVTLKSKGTNSTKKQQRSSRTHHSTVMFIIRKQ